MNKIILTLVCLSFCNLSFENIQKSGFEIEILQDDDFVDVFDNEVTLEKAPFTLRVKMFGIDGVYLNASYSDKLFEVGQAGKIPDFRFINTKAMAEDAMNKKKELVLSESLYSFLNYDAAAKTHPFDSVQIEAGHVVGYKTIENLNDKDSGKAIKMEKIKKDLYLFFVATSPHEKGLAPQELGRTRIHVKWD